MAAALPGRAASQRALKRPDKADAEPLLETSLLAPTSKYTLAAM
jgi:hypothetical protein